MDYSDFEDLHVEVSDGIGRFQVTRPERLNALRTQTFWEIVELGRRFQNDRDVRVVLCTHTGRGFSSGADIVDRDPTAPEERPEAPPTDSMGISTMGLAMPRIDKPTIASINGVCAGAGFAFASSFDLRFLGPNARFITVFARRGLGPDCGLTYHLPRLVGQAKALELRGWGYPKHLAGRVYGVIVHGDVSGFESTRRSLCDWLDWMGLIDAGPLARLDRSIGYYAPYATSHAELDRDVGVQEEVRNVARAVVQAIAARRAGGLTSPDAGLERPRPK